MKRVALKKKPLGRPTTDRADRDERGRFAAGNRLARGNPIAVQIARFREGVAAAVTVDDLQDIMRKLVRLAKQGDVAAAKVVLERCLGQPQATDLVVEINRIRETIQTLEGY